jgi:threonyl-tRNA synthetase
LNQITITFDNDKKRSFQKGISVIQVIKTLYPKIFQSVLAVILDGQAVDLNETIEKDTSLQLLTWNKPDGLQVFWHSASHIMAQAVTDLYPDVQLGIGPAISNGFYYDFHMPVTIGTDDFEKIEKNINDIIKVNQSFHREILPKSEVISLFKKRNEPFKVELIEDLPDDSISIYRNGDFLDLCRGPHVPSTGYIKHLKLLSVAGAYWHGDERNAVMQRIYGIAFPEKKSLDQYLINLEETKKRDHRRLGKELDLFSFHIEGPGFPFWHANGMVLSHEVMDYMREVLTEEGYLEIKTPIILNEDLWHRSGHWDNYKENMYFTEIDKQLFAVKPMNCPGCLLVYKNELHSYRELPLKLSEMGLVHRHEKSGVLHGLFRVRQFTQDDAHVFCTPDQIEQEVIKLIDLVEKIYHTFGYERYKIELSTRPAKSIGSDEAWDLAETALKNALDEKKVAFELNKGEGAFYGPKIDYHIEDSLGRLWQCGTIQVDFSMPERFDLEFVGSDGDRHRPVMIHRAILGSVERFIGILIEHYGGAFPVWLAPVQILILPISEKHHEYAQEIYQRCVENGLRTHLDVRNEKVGYKIRDAEKKKIPYMCVIGDKEIENNMVSIRKRKVGDMGEKNLDDFIHEVQNEIKRRANH